MTFPLFLEVILTRSWLGPLLQVKFSLPSFPSKYEIEIGFYWGISEIISPVFELTLLRVLNKAQTREKIESRITCIRMPKTSQTKTTQEIALVSNLLTQIQIQLRDQARAT